MGAIEAGIRDARGERPPRYLSRAAGGDVFVFAPGPSPGIDQPSGAVSVADAVAGKAGGIASGSRLIVGDRSEPAATYAIQRPSDPNAGATQAQSVARFRAHRAP